MIAVSQNILDISGLNVDFESRRGSISAVRDVDLQIRAGEILGIVGESGAGKSTIGAAITGLLPAAGRISGGTIRISDKVVDATNVKAMRALRGKQVSMIFQDPMTSLNPLFTIEKQLVDTIRFHSTMSVDEARRKALEHLEAVGIPEAGRRIKDWPHQFSGGMRQRAVIALALCTKPKLIIADEPTTALDLSVQTQILSLIRRLALDGQVAVMLITHDMGAIAQVADRVAVMKDGEIVETERTSAILQCPKHPYSRSLISVVPRANRKLRRFPISNDGVDIDAAMEWLSAESNRSVVGTDVPAIELRNLEHSYGSGSLKVLHDVNFTVAKGEVMGLVGGSGSGKSTIARIIAGLQVPTSGHVLLSGTDVYSATKQQRQIIRRETQMVFQDPYSSLNSQMRVDQIIAEPMLQFGLVSNRRAAEPIVYELLHAVGLDASSGQRYPHAFSGGQRQRISIARALASRPRLLICDEPTSALDVSIQAQILNLLKDLQERLSLSVLFVSHDLPVVRQMCDRITVLAQGQVCEVQHADALFESPKHEYTVSLLSLIAEMPAPAA